MSPNTELFFQPPQLGSGTGIDALMPTMPARRESRAATRGRQGRRCLLMTSSVAQIARAICTHETVSLQ